MYVTFFIIPRLFVFIITYILMRLPICNRMLNRWGISMKSTLYKDGYY